MNIKLPELGEGIENVEVTDVLVSKGSSIKIDDIVVVVESDKASMEIPTKQSGIVKNIPINKGDTLKPGDIIIEIDSNSNEIDEIEHAEPGLSEEKDNSENISENIVNSIEETIPIETAPDSINLPAAKTNNSNEVIATPSVRKLARELGCDLSVIKGSEKNNRITKEDVLNHVKTSLNQSLSAQSNNKKINLEERSNPLEKKQNIQAQEPEKQKKASKVSIDEEAFLKFGSIEKILFNKIRSVTSDRMSTSWNTIPHVTHFDEVQIDHILSLKKDIESITKSKKVSILTFISQALIKTLYSMKKFNSTADIQNQILIIKNYINLGIAVDTPNGLVVPNLKNAQDMSIKEINDTIITTSEKARKGKLSPNDMSGGTFTISSLGGIGGKFFTPIINYPEVAIMGISRAYTDIKLDSKNSPTKVKILPFSLSYDHRVIDGAEAARFCNLFKENIKKLSSV